MKIAPQPWIKAAPTRALLKALGNAGIAARFVGGCVRDALLGRPIADVDLATPARPEEVVAALEKARIKVVPTGIEHGTVTAVFNAPAPPRHFEITPIVGIVEPPFVLAIDPFEVAEAFEVPLAFILDRRNHQRVEREVGAHSRSYFILPFESRNIWGATAGILVNLAEVLAD